MILFIILIAVEIMTFIVIYKIFYDKFWIRYYFVMLVNISKHTPLGSMVPAFIVQRLL